MISTSKIHHVPPSHNHITADPNGDRQSSKDAVPRPLVDQDPPQDHPLRQSIKFKPLETSSAQSEYSMASNAQTIFDCPFNAPVSSLSCSVRFYNFEEWQAHSISHFKEVGPPQNVQCCFCNKSFSGIIGVETWKDYMRHLATHQREGCQMLNARPSFDLYKYMFEKHLISSLEYRALQMNPAYYITKALPDFNKFNVNRFEDPWTPIGTRRASPGLEIPGSRVFSVNSQHDARPHPLRELHLTSDEKEHGKLVRKHGPCIECRQRKKRVLDSLFQIQRLKN